MMDKTKKIASWLFLVLFFNVNSIYGLRVLGIFPINAKSHFAMSGRLMRGLAARGHKVDVYSHFPLKKPVSNYRDFSLAGTMPAVANNMTYELLTSLTNGVSISQIVRMISPTCDLLDLPIFQELINNPPKDSPYDVVITEMFFTNCYLAWGRHLNIPMVAVATTTMFDWMNAPLGNPTNLAADPSIYLQRATPMSFSERVRNVFVSTRVTWEFNTYVQDQNVIVKRVFGSDFPDVIELQKDISLLLLNYHQALNGIRAFTPAVVPVGGLHIFDNGDKLPPNVKKFLDESKYGFIYFSFGSMVQFETFPKHIQEAFYNAFIDIAPVRVLMKIAKPEFLPRKLPSNVISHTWLPQIKVLKHKNIKAFITHGGLMGTQEAIYYDVPMIGIPLVGDQHFNMESYAKKDMAVILDHHYLTEEIITQALNEVLENPLYKESVEKVSKAFRKNPMDPVETSAFWIEYVVQNGKDSLRSPLVDMPWWQVQMIDVYGFIILVVLVVLYTVMFVLNQLIRMLSLSKRFFNLKLKRN